jgi:hypothetical protein
MLLPMNSLVRIIYLPFRHSSPGKLLNDAKSSPDVLALKRCDRPSKVIQLIGIWQIKWHRNGASSTDVAVSTNLGKSVINSVSLQVSSMIRTWQLQ